jgi:hypothetical protein
VYGDDASQSILKNTGRRSGRYEGDEASAKPFVLDLVQGKNPLVQTS